MTQLQGKVALITGAASGIGAACAHLFANHGAAVYATDLDEPGAKATADAIGESANHLLLDVREESHWTSALATILNNHNTLDILINNAGITGFTGFNPPLGPHDPEHASLDAWRAVHATNLDGVFLGCKHAIRAMKNTGGSIVNISSRSGQVGIPLAAAYASSKAAVRNHTKTVALYCAQMRYPIRCNSIHPGAILTPMWNAMLGEGPQREAGIAQASSEVPLGRMGTPDEVAHMALYLAGPNSAYVTGAEFVIDGGILAGTHATPTTNQ